MNHYLGVTVVNMLGKALALLKVLFLASTFGTAYQLDAFYIAYLLPIMLPDVFKGIVNTAFIPHFTRHKDSNPTYFWQGMTALVSLTLLIQVLLAAAMFVWASSIVDLLAQDADAQTRALATDLIRVLSAIMPLLGLNALLVTLSHANNKFLMAASESAITNALIIAFLLFAAEPDVVVLSVSVALGFAVFFLAMLYENWGEFKAHFRFRWNIYDASLATPIRQSLPLLIGYAGAMGIEIIDLRFVAKLEEGSISAFNYAVMLANLPFDIFIAAIIFTAYPTLSRHLAEQRSIVDLYRLGISRVLFFAVPSALIFVFMGQAVIELLLRSGAFDARSVALTDQALMWFGIALIPKGLAYFHYRILHASLRSWTQVLIGLLGVVTNALLNLALYKPFGLAGITAATALSLCQSLILSFIVVYRQEFRGVMRDLLRDILRPLALPFIVVAAVLLVLQYADALITFSHHKVDAGFDLLLTGVCGLVVIFAFRWQSLPEIESAKQRVVTLVKKCVPTSAA